MEFLTDLVATVDEAPFAHCKGLERILQPFRPERRGSSYRLRGTFTQLEELSFKLLALSQTYAPSSPSPCHAASARCEPVEVSDAVLTYIREKRGEKLDEILGQGFDIETESRKASGGGGTLLVTFRPRPVPARRVPVAFVRQRFVTFYQRTASDLEAASVRVPPRCDPEALQDRFPSISFLWSRGGSEGMALGPFDDVAKLRAYLAAKAAGSSRSREDPRSNQRAAAATATAASPKASPSRVGTTQSRDDPCLICMEPILDSERSTLACSHSFCRDCLKTAFKYKPVCPTCGRVFGPLTGTQPPGGQMRVARDASSLPGHGGCGTLIISYSIPGGVQGEEHPNPGKRYDGVSRTAYLPDSSEGKEVMMLLKRAFDQRLIFTVGQSTTTGRSNTVTWNDIHHKTSTHGGPTHYGYPDPDYLQRVRDELKVKGIE